MENIFKNHSEETDSEKSSKLFSMLADLFMESKHTPEPMKISLVLTKAGDALVEEIFDLMKYCTLRKLSTYTDGDIKTLKNTIEYLEFVRAGIHQYREQISIDAKKEE